jgi:predicted membrane protein
MGLTARIVIGIVLVAVGIGILLDRLDVWDFAATVGTYWPLILVLIGGTQLATRTAPAWVGLLLLLLGAFFLARNLDVIPADWTTYILPAVLVFIGLLILIGPAVRRKRRRNDTIGGPPRQHTSAAGWIERFAIFGGSDTKSRADPFTGGELTAVFGGVSLDLSEARLPREWAELEATAVFGGVEIKIPRDWRVEVNGTPILGGIDIKALEPEDPDAPVLRIEATAIFGGVDIQNPK